MRCPGCGAQLVHTGTIRATFPSLCALVLTIAMAAQGYIGRIAVFWVVVANFAVTLWLLPYLARMEVLKPTDETRDGQKVR
jgi:hypothetical protein